MLLEQCKELRGHLVPGVCKASMRLCECMQSSLPWQLVVLR